MAPSDLTKIPDCPEIFINVSMMLELQMMSKSQYIIG